jgi:hypothetical protein
VTVCCCVCQIIKKLIHAAQPATGCTISVLRVTGRQQGIRFGMQAAAALKPAAGWHTPAPLGLAPRVVAAGGPAVGGEIFEA